MNLLKGSQYKIKVNKNLIRNLPNLGNKFLAKLWECKRRNSDEVYMLSLLQNNFIGKGTIEHPYKIKNIQILRNLKMKLSKNELDK